VRHTLCNRQSVCCDLFCVCWQTVSIDSLGSVGCLTILICSQNVALTIIGNEDAVCHLDLVLCFVACRFSMLGHLPVAHASPCALVDAYYSRLQASTPLFLAKMCIVGTSLKC
jgi:hypothetical protein